MKYTIEEKLRQRIRTRVRRNRNPRGWSQADVAERVGLTTEYWARIERGVSLPSSQTLITIAIGLGLSIDWLVGLGDSEAAKRNLERHAIEPEDPPDEDPKHIKLARRRVRQLIPEAQHTVGVCVDELCTLHGVELSPLVVEDGAIDPPDGDADDDEPSEVETWIRKRIGARILEARKARGLTQQAAAERIGRSTEYWARLERGQTKGFPSLYTLYQIAAKFELSIDSMVGLDDEVEAVRVIEHYRVAPAQDSRFIESIFERVVLLPPKFQRIVATLIQNLSESKDFVVKRGSAKRSRSRR